MPEGVDARPWLEAISRLGSLLYLASLIPVVIECRFSHFRRPAVPEKAEEKEASDKSASAAGAEAAAPPAAKSTVLGLACPLLLAASELMSSYELFLELPARKPGRKSSTATSGGGGTMLTALLRGIDAAKGVATGHRGNGFVNQGAAVVTTALAAPDAFAAAHAMVILLALATTVGHVAMNQRLRIRSLAGVVLLVAFLGVLGGLQQELLQKVWKGLLADKIVAALRLPLRAAALLAAELPAVDPEKGGTPGVFAALQLGSLLSMISTEVVGEKLALTVNKLLVKLRTASSGAAIVGALVDSPVLTTLLPLALAAIWLSVTHLNRRPGSLMLAALVSMLASPLAFTVGWPKLAAFLQLPPSQAGPEPIVQMITLLYTSTTLLFLLTGGTTSFICGMLASHAFVSLHGLEKLGLQ